VDVEVDEKRLAELFNDAVQDVPPASFDTGDVRKASHRATIKRRNNVFAGSALAFVLLAGGTVTAISLLGETPNTTAASAPALGGAPMANSGTMDDSGAGASASEAEKSAARGDAPGPHVDTRSGPPKQGGGPTGNAGTAGSTPSGCKAVRELAAALAGELPAAASKIEVEVPFGCPEPAGGAAFAVTDGDKRGTVSVVRVPAGAEPGIVPMGSDVAGYASTESPAASGGSIYVVSQPSPGTAEAPFVNEISRYATEIAKRF
jgi:hypothetical protein